MFKKTSLRISSQSSPFAILHQKARPYPAAMSTKNFGDAQQRAADTSAHEQRFDQEKEVKRNPHADFSKVEDSRPDWDVKNEWHFTKTKKPGWKLGQGANDGGESVKKDHVEIDPYEEGRPAVFNYKLLISGIIPRPIGFVSTRSEDGMSLHHQ